MQPVSETGCMVAKQVTVYFDSGFVLTTSMEGGDW